MPLPLDRRTLLTALGASALAPAFAYARAPAMVPQPDAEKMIPVEGGRIYARLNGKVGAGKPPLLLIHGGPGGTHGGLTPILPLADERAVILYDQLDSGRSDHPGDPKNWRVQRFVDEVDAVRRAFGLERVHVCGHSWGGTVALEYAARRPAGLASAVLASPLVSTRRWIADADTLREDLPAPTRTTLEQCETAQSPSQADCNAATDAFYAQYLVRTAEGPDLIAYEHDHGGAGFNGTLYQAMWGKTEFSSTGTLRNYDGEPLLARLDGPRTLFMCGQYDEARPLTIAGFARRVPGAEFAVVPGSGHAITIDRPAETNMILRSWLARHDMG